MSVKQLIIKLIPKRVKEYIKAQINYECPVPKPTEYVIHTSDLKKLEGKAIIVTGATGAIGSAVTHQLYIQGATVGVCGRDMAKVSKTIDRIKSENINGEGQLIPLCIDVTDNISIENGIDEFYRQTGKIDALINNAGGGARGSSKKLWEQDIEIIDRVIKTNLQGSILCARKAAQIMTKQSSGVIVNMSSVVGMRGKEKMTDYAAAKAGIIGLTKSLAIELGKYNIRVNCISPGMVNQIPFDTGLPIKSTNANCLGRFGYTDEVADLVSFVVSDQAKYITGHNFVIDGGRSLGLYGD